MPFLLLEEPRTQLSVDLIKSYRFSPHYSMNICLALYTIDFRAACVECKSGFWQIRMRSSGLINTLSWFKLTVLNHCNGQGCWSHSYKLHYSCHLVHWASDGVHDHRILLRLDEIQMSVAQQCLSAPDHNLPCCLLLSTCCKTARNTKTKSMLR